MEQLEKITIYPAAETILTKKQLEAGIERLEKEEKEYEAALRAKHQIEEASRIRGIIKELTEGITQGWKRDGLDAYIRYFCPETVSFLDYFPAGDTLICLDEPARLKDKGETVEQEFRESMIHRLEKGYLLPGQTELLYAGAQVLAKLQSPYRYQDHVPHGLHNLLLPVPKSSEWLFPGNCSFSVVFSSFLCQTCHLL